MAARRQRLLQLSSADEVIDEIERLRQSGYTMTGRWNLSQICEHVRRTIRIGIDGDQKRLPWLFRKTLGAFFLGRVLRTGHFPSGGPTLPRLVPEPTSIAEDPAMIAAAIATIREAAAFAGPLPPHPLVDGLSLDQWKRLMFLHASHHLAYLIPVEHAVKPVSGL